MPNDTANVGMESAGAIAHDVKCVGCGYNLRGLSADHNCPECGAHVFRSLQSAAEQGSLLCFADRQWLEKLRLGTTLKLWGILVGFAAAFLLVLLQAIGLPQQVELLLMIPPGVLGLWAAFLITAQEPRITLEEQPVTLRRAIRFCASTTFISDLVARTTLLAAVRPAHVSLFAYTAVAGLVQIFGEFVYYRRFALRLPDPNLADRTRTVMWGFCIAFAATAISAGGVALQRGAMAAGTLAPIAIQTTMLVAGCFLVVLYLIFGIWYIVLLVQYRRRFRDAITQAEVLTVMQAIRGA